MPHITLSRMPSGIAVVLTFTEETQFKIDNGAEGATILTLQLNRSEHIVHVRETRWEILEARRAALVAWRMTNEPPD